MIGRVNRRSSWVQAQLSWTLPTLENPMMEGFRVQLLAEWVARLAAHDDNHVDQLRRALEGRP